jgi:TPR repeat protein
LQDIRNNRQKGLEIVFNDSINNILSIPFYSCSAFVQGKEDVSTYCNFPVSQKFVLNQTKVTITKKIIIQPFTGKIITIFDDETTKQPLEKTTDISVLRSRIYMLYSDRKFKEAFKEAKQLALKKDAEGIFLSGVLRYFDDTDTLSEEKKNWEIAQIVKQAADLGSTKAQYAWAREYASYHYKPLFDKIKLQTDYDKLNEEVLNSKKEALYKCIAQKYLPSYILMGALIYAEDSLRAVQYWKKASDMGDRNAKYQLAMLHYDHQKYVVTDIKAIKLLQENAETYHVESLLVLGAAYLTGSFVEKSEAKSLRCFQIAAEQGDLTTPLRERGKIFSQYRLGYHAMYTEGLPKKARYWYRRAVKYGSAARDLSAIPTLAYLNP